MAQVTIWLPDELKNEVKGWKINISKICQQALRAEIERRQESVVVHAY